MAKKIIDENEIDTSEIDNPFEDFPEGQEIKVYRMTGSGETEFCGEVNAPYTVNQLKNDFGGGKYYLYAYKQGKLIAKRKLNVAGMRKEPNETKEITIRSESEKLSDIAEIIRAVKEIQGNSGNIEGMQKMLEIMSTSVLTSITTMMGVMTENIRNMQELQKEQKGSTLYDLLGNALNNITDIAVQYIDYKKKSELNIQGGKQEERRNEKNMTIIDLINEAQKTKMSIPNLVQRIKNTNNPMIVQLKNYKWEIVKSELIKYGLNIIDEKYLIKLYDELIK